MLTAPGGRTSRRRALDALAPPALPWQGKVADIAADVAAIAVARAVAFALVHVAAADRAQRGAAFAAAPTVYGAPVLGMRTAPPIEGERFHHHHLLALRSLRTGSQRAPGVAARGVTAAAGEKRLDRAAWRAERGGAPRRRNDFFRAADAERRASAPASPAVAPCQAAAHFNRRRRRPAQRRQRRGARRAVTIATGVRHDDRNRRKRRALSRESVAAKRPPAREGDFMLILTRV